MTQISIRKSDLDSLLVEARRKVEGIGTLKSDINREYLAKAVFNISGKAFIKRTAVLAVSSPKSFHHIYEWGAIGRDDKRLFRLVRTSVKGGRLTISSRFTDSKSSVPIKKGKSNKTMTSHVFRKKATIMELGRPVLILPKRGKMLAFPGKNGEMIFTKRSYVRNPGGRAVKGSFDSHMKSWFQNPTNVKNAVYASGIMIDIQKEMSLALNKKGAGVPEANRVIRSVSAKYSQGGTTL